MTPSTIIGFVNNAALLVALVLIYDVFAMSRPGEKPAIGQVFPGFILGCIGVGIMMNPWEFLPGIIFDTRSVLLSVTGFFFGAIPTLVAVAVTGGYRFAIGGTGAWTGVAVIITSAGVGLAWRKWRNIRLEDASSRDLFALGIVTHVLMLLWMLTLPRSIAFGVLSKISIPILLVFPLGTVLLGKLMTKRIQRLDSIVTLEKSEEKYRNLIESLQEGIWVIDRDNLTTFVNPPMADILGYTVEEMVGKHLFSFMDEKAVEIAGQKLQDRQKGISEKHEFEFLRKDGSTAAVVMATRPKKDTDGGYDGAIAGVIDITKRKQSEEALYTANHKLNLAMQAANEGFWEWNLATNEAYFDDKALQMLEYCREDIRGPMKTGSWWMEQVHPDDKSDMEGKFNQYISGVADSYQVEFRLRSKDGHYVWVDSAAQVLSRDSNGDPQVVIGIHQDISKRKRAEEKLRNSRDLLSEMARQVPGVIYQFYSRQNGEMGLYYVSERAEQIIGLKADLDGFFRRFTELIIPEQRKAFLESIRKASKEISPWDFEGVLQKPTGERINFSGHSTPSVRETEIVFNGIILDITQRKKAEEEHKGLQARLMQTQKLESIGTLAGGIAHDFNNILSSIIGFAELALDEVETETSVEDSLQEIHAAGIRAKNLVRQILAASRQDEKEVKPIQVAPLIKEALKMLRSIIPTSIAFRENICSDPLIIQADTTQIHQVIINLATNAKQAMAEGNGVLGVGVDAVVFGPDIQSKYPDMQPGDYVRITVSDTGSGIPAENLEKIFEPYFTTKEKGEGTGLGLSVVHGIVKSHNGHITVYSEPGKGTTFHVYLPQIKRVSADLPEKAAEPLATGTERILVVDDEPPIVKMQQQNLQRLGYTVTESTSSAEALEAFRKSPDEFDLVVTDMTMPGMTGEKLAEEIKAIRSDIPVILCTGFSERIKDHGEDLDVDAFLMKPVDKAKMAKTIRKILDNEE